MKTTKQLKTIAAIIFAGIFCAYNVQGQTKGSGAMTNSCGTLANDGGTAGTTSIGCGAGKAGMTGQQNTNIGASAGTALTSGANNTFIGYQSGTATTSGVSNVFLGLNSGLANTASYNTFLGYQNGASNTSGTYNTLVGFDAGYYNQTGSNNTITGFEAGGLGFGSTTNGSFSNNSMFGYQAGYKNSTGSQNLFSGYQAGYTNSTGSYNCFLGYNAGYANTTTSENVFVGSQSGLSNTSGGTDPPNVFVGSQTGYTNTTGNGNAFLGYKSGYTNNASENTFLGDHSGYSTTTGGYNVAVGETAGNANTTGYNNVMVGPSAGSTYAAETTATFLGSNADANANNLSNITAIGNGAIVTTGSNTIWAGNSAITTFNITGTATYVSDGRFKTNVTENVKGLSFIKKLRPITYNMDTKSIDDFIIQNMPDSVKAIHKKGMDFAPSMAIVHSGFIAQEVEQAGKDVGFTSSIVKAPANNTDIYGIAYQEIVVPLVKAMQELSHTVDSLSSHSKMTDSLLADLQNCCHLSQRTINSGSEQGNASQIDVTLATKKIVLDQNSPNPFKEQTSITYVIPKDANSVMIIITDMSGDIIKEVPITDKGKGQLNIYASDLSSGIYTYSIVADGVTIDTKKMVKTK